MRPIPLPQPIKRALDRPWIRRLARRETRELLAARFLKGDGVEVGALHNPLPLPPWTRVRYVDHPAEFTEKHYADIDGTTVRQPDIISELETMEGIADASLDFVIANHVLEHVENVFQALTSVARVLRRGGIAFLAVPDKRFTFDRDRPLTSLWHIVKDYTDGPDWSRGEHYRECLANIHHLSGELLEKTATEWERDCVNIHFHVWDERAMRQMFERVQATPSIGLRIVHSQLRGNEVIWILRKP